MVLLFCNGSKTAPAAKTIRPIVVIGMSITSFLAEDVDAGFVCLKLMENFDEGVVI